MSKMLEQIKDLKQQFNCAQNYFQKMRCLIKLQKMRKLLQNGLTNTQNANVKFK